MIVKPDGVARGLVEEVFERVEIKGYKIERMETRSVDRDLALNHYGEHEGEAFFDDLISFITSGPVVVAIISGKGCIEGLREIMGSTNPEKAAPGTIRSDFGTSIRKNIVHGSDSPTSAAREIALFFPE